MPFNYAESFNRGLEYHKFLETHGQQSDREQWQAIYDRIELSDGDRDRLSRFRRQMKVLVMAGAWCGDCVAQCPAFLRFAEVNPNIQLRFVDNQADTALAEELNLCGAARVPQVIFMAEDDAVIGRYGDRTLSRYLAMSASLEQGQSSDPFSNPLLGQVVADWLNEFERCQLILHTSPRLRRKHGES